MERITRSLAFMLRHQPEKFDIEVDAYGFADTGEVVRALNERLGEPVDMDDLLEAVESGDRRRYEVQGDRIRALYGHSIPVEPGEPSKPPEVLYLGIDARDAERARKYGLRGGRRRFLHLALTEEDAIEVGRRIAEEYTIVEVSAIEAWEDGVDFYDRGSLFLAEEVPTQLIRIGETYDNGEPPRYDAPRGNPRRGRDDDRRGGRGGRGRGGRGRDDDRGPREERGGRGDRDRDRDRDEDRDRGPREERAERGDRDRGRDEERDRGPRAERGDRDRDRDEDRDRGPRGERGDRGRGRDDDRGPRGDRGGRGGRDRDRGRDGGRGEPRGRTPERRDEAPRQERPAAAEREPRREERRPEPRREVRSTGGGFGAGLTDTATAPPPRRSEPAPEPRPEPKPAPPRPEPPKPAGPGFGAGL